ncbi:hypothetical protein ACCS56_37485, partial [Rhizobium ruizarguesonis]
ERLASGLIISEICFDLMLMSLYCVDKFYIEMCVVLGEIFLVGGVLCGCCGFICRAGHVGSRLAHDCGGVFSI